MFSAPQHKPRPLPLFLELVKRETAGNPERLARVLKGLRAYQEAPRANPPIPMPVVAKAHGAMLRDYGGDGTPVLFIPSLINPPTVLDLTENRSLLRWLAQRGHHVLLLDWGKSHARRDLSITDHVTEIILPMMQDMEEPPHLVGYCLGGTMAIAAATVAPAKSVAAIAAPWHFSAYASEAKAMLRRLWQGGAASAASLGVLPMEVLQAAFWQLDPARTVAKYESFASLEATTRESQGFVALEDWANDGPPLPEAAARQLFVGFFEEDLAGSGCWEVAGQVVNPARLSCPHLNIVSTSDRIVPHSSADRSGQRLELASGHVGMIVGTNAPRRLWTSLSDWLSSV
jgi:polyhydroxyalkanoate synthase subunit PhaC